MCTPLPVRSQDLSTLFDFGRSVVPALVGRVVATAPLLNDSAQAPTRALLASLSQRYPQGGRAHWSLRGWSLLVWQPIYLAVIAAEGQSVCVPMDRLQLQVEDDDVTAFSLPADTVVTAADVATCRALAARQITRTCTSVLAALQAVLPLPAKAAQRVQADCVLAALLRLRTADQLDGDNAALRALGAHWLDLLGAEGCSSFFGYAGEAGRECLAVDRRLCCLEHRLPGASMCSTCPKLKPAERAARLLARDRALSHRALRSTT